MQESKLYLVFEFLSMDLKKYLDSIPSGQFMEPMLVKVHYIVYKMCSHDQCHTLCVLGCTLLFN